MRWTDPSEIPEFLHLAKYLGLSWKVSRSNQSSNPSPYQGIQKLSWLSWWAFWKYYKNINTAALSTVEQTGLYIPCSRSIRAIKDLSSDQRLDVGPQELYSDRLLEGFNQIIAFFTCWVVIVVFVVFFLFESVSQIIKSEKFWDEIYQVLVLRLPRSAASGGKCVAWYISPTNKLGKSLNCQQGILQRILSGVSLVVASICRRIYKIPRLLDGAHFRCEVL